MALKRRLARFAAPVERAVDRVRRRPTTAQIIAPYAGYATPTHLVVRGRVLGKATTSTVAAGQGRLRNLYQMIRLFLTDEVADVMIRHGDYSVQSDEEGYFTLLVPRDDRTGWVDVTVEAGPLTATCPVLIPDPDAEFGVISDIDDTMMQTGAYSLWRNIWTSLTGNALTRNVFPDAVTLMDLLHEGGRNPIYFVSSSPWNLHGFLDQVFDRHGLPKAPKFLRDYGISDTQFITGTHGDHKGSAIDRIMAANPDLSFVLIGDTGQHDAQVYLDAVGRHPGRVRQVILRTAGHEDAADKAAFAALQETAVPVHAGPTYDGVIADLRPRS